MLGYTVSEVRIVTSRNRFLRHVTQLTVVRTKQNLSTTGDVAQPVEGWLSMHELPPQHQICKPMFTQDVEKELHN